MSNVPLTLGLLFVAAITLPMIPVALRRKLAGMEAAEAARAAGLLGLAFTSRLPKGGIAEFGDYRLFRMGNLRRGRHLMRGEVDGLDVAILKYSFQTLSPFASPYRTGSLCALVALFPRAAGGLPEFLLWPGGGGAAMPGVDIYPAGKIDLRRDDRGSGFARLYHLAGEDTPALRGVFDAGRRGSLAELPGWQVASHGGTLVLWRRFPGGSLPPRAEAYVAFVEDAAKVVRLFRPGGRGGTAGRAS